MSKLILSLFAVLSFCLNLHAQDFFSDVGNEPTRDQQVFDSNTKEEAPEEKIVQFEQPSPVEQTKLDIKANEDEGTGKAFNELPDQDENGCLIGEKGDSCRSVIGRDEDKNAERLAAKDVKENFNGINVNVAKCTSKEFYYSNFEVCDYFFKKLN